MSAIARNTTTTTTTLIVDGMTCSHCVTAVICVSSAALATRRRINPD
jgi:hypothetical protein